MFRTHPCFPLTDSWLSPHFISILNLWNHCGLYLLDLGEQIHKILPSGKGHMDWQRNRKRLTSPEKRVVQSFIVECCNHFICNKPAFVRHWLHNPSSRSPSWKVHSASLYIQSGQKLNWAVTKFLRNYSEMLLSQSSYYICSTTEKLRKCLNSSSPSLMVYQTGLVMPIHAF